MSIADGQCLEILFLKIGLVILLRAALDIGLETEHPVGRLPVVAGLDTAIDAIGREVANAASSHRPTAKIARPIIRRKSAPGFREKPGNTGITCIF